MKNQKGITLLALVITIIIMLILAGIVISLTIGENGIIKRAQLAEKEYKEAESKEKLQLKIINLQTEVYETEQREATLNDLSLYLAKENYELIIVNEETTYGKVSYEGYEFMINEQLEIIGSEYEGDKLTIAQKLLLTIGDESNKNLEEILEDEALLGKLLTTDESIDFIIKNKNEFMEKFISNPNVMTKIANSEKMMDRIVNDSNWANEILNNENSIKILDESNPITVPYMTGYTTPKGQVIYSSEYSSGHPAYYPFHSRRDWESTSNFPQYIGYKFEKPVWVYKCFIFYSNDGAAREMKLQKSDNGIDWTDVFNDFTYVNTDEKATDVINSKENVGRATYWRLYIEKSTGKTVDMQDIQFYGK